MSDEASEFQAAVANCADEFGLVAQGLIARGFPVETIALSLNTLYLRETLRNSGWPDPLGDEIERRKRPQSSDNTGMVCTVEFNRVMMDLLDRGFRPDAVSHALILAAARLDK